MINGDRFTSQAGDVYTYLGEDDRGLVLYRRNGDEGRMDARTFHRFFELGYFKWDIDTAAVEARLELAFRNFLKAYHRGVPVERVGILHPLVLARWLPVPRSLHHVITEDMAERAWKAATS